MARSSERIFDSGERLPAATMETTGHGRITVPDWFGGRWGVFLLYRAHW